MQRIGISISISNGNGPSQRGEGRGGDEIDKEEDDTSSGGTTTMTTDSRYCPSTSYAVGVIVVGLSINSNLKVVHTVKSPRELAEMLARYMEEELLYPGEEGEGGGGQ